MGSNVALAKFPLSPGRFAWGNIALFSCTSPHARSCTLRHQTRSKAEEWLLGLREERGQPPPCSQSPHPADRFPPKCFREHGMLQGESCLHISSSASAVQSPLLQALIHPGSVDFFPSGWGHIEFTFSKSLWVVWAPSCQGYCIILLFTSSFVFKHWQKELTKVLNTDSTCAYKSAEHLKVH